MVSSSLELKHSTHDTSALSCTLLRFYTTNFLKTAVPNSLVLCAEPSNGSDRVESILQKTLILGNLFPRLPGCASRSDWSMASITFVVSGHMRTNLRHGIYMIRFILIDCNIQQLSIDCR